MRKGICDDFQIDKCFNQFGSRMDKQCRRCDRKRAQDLSPYTLKMMTLLNLKTAGYPFEKNDLAPEEWKDLGMLIDTTEKNKRKQPIAVYLVKIK